VASIEWTTDNTFTVDGVSFVSAAFLTPDAGAGPGHMFINKARKEIEEYAALIEEMGPRSILELGVFKGGSAALLALLARPDRLVAVDIEPSCSPLERFIEAQDLRSTISTHYGVDQADLARLDEIIADEFDAPIDLIIDDASHLVAETRASFNRLFPHLRPGGLYVIEDWGWAHARYADLPPVLRGVAPLSVFACELVLASACRPEVVAGFSGDANKLVIERGPRPLDPARFDVLAHFGDVGDDMVARVEGARTR
jgi:predicted O-methyltransferase YrrM